MLLLVFVESMSEQSDVIPRSPNDPMVRASVVCEGENGEILRLAGIVVSRSTRIAKTCAVSFPGGESLEGKNARGVGGAKEWRASRKW